MTPPNEGKTPVFAYVLGVFGTFLIMAVLVLLMRHYTRPAPIDAARAEERKRLATELNAQAKEQLDNYGWIDQGKGLVRLPIAQAMELTVKSWQNPAAGRSNLLTRLEKATAAPPKAPEQPSEFE